MTDYHRKLCAVTTPDIFVVSIILVVGFVLRVLGIGVGLPDSPDPRETLIAQDVLNLISFTAPPEIYNWPGTAWFYLTDIYHIGLEPNSNQ